MILVKTIVETTTNRHAFAFAFDFFVFLSLRVLIWVMVGLFGNRGISKSSSMAS